MHSLCVDNSLVQDTRTMCIFLWEKLGKMYSAHSTSISNESPKYTTKGRSLKSFCEKVSIIKKWQFEMEKKLKKFGNQLLLSHIFRTRNSKKQHVVSWHLCKNFGRPLCDLDMWNQLNFSIYTITPSQRNTTFLIVDTSYFNKWAQTNTDSFKGFRL